MLGLVANNANSIYTLRIPGRKGIIGMMPCPGIRLESPRRGNIQKNLRRDLAACREWGASGILTLNEPDELFGLGVGELGGHVTEAGFWWRNLPIADMGVPDDSFEVMWAVEGKQIAASLIAGERVILHCLAGLGRTGMIAARLLVDMGMSPQLAVAEVRKIRPRAIQTEEQEKYVYKFGRKIKKSSPASISTGGAYATTPRGPIKGFGT